MIRVIPSALKGAVNYSINFYKFRLDDGIYLSKVKYTVGETRNLNHINHTVVSLPSVHKVSGKAMITDFIFLPDPHFNVDDTRFSKSGVTFSFPITITSVNEKLVLKVNQYNSIHTDTVNKTKVVESIDPDLSEYTIELVEDKKYENRVTDNTCELIYRSSRGTEFLSDPIHNGLSITEKKKENDRTFYTITLSVPKNMLVKSDSRIPIAVVLRHDIPLRFELPEQLLDKILTSSRERGYVKFNIMVVNKDPVISEEIYDTLDMKEYMLKMLTHDSIFLSNQTQLNSNGETIVFKFNRPSQVDVYFDNELLGANLKTDLDGVLTVNKSSKLFSDGGEFVIQQKHNFNKRERNKRWTYTVKDTNPPADPVYLSATPYVLFGTGPANEQVFLEKGGEVISSTTIPLNGSFDLLIPTDKQLQLNETVVLYTKDRADNYSNRVSIQLSNLLQANLVQPSTLDQILEGRSL